MKLEAADSKLEKAVLREQILQSAVDSFKIEGIIIPTDLAQAVLKKIEANSKK